jgi:GPI-anchor transamidase subunit S
MASRVESQLNGGNDLRFYDFRVSHGAYNDSWPTASERDWVFSVLLDDTADVDDPEAKLRSWTPLLDIRTNSKQFNDKDGIATLIANQIRDVFRDEQESLSYLLSDTPFASGRESLLTPEAKAALDARTTRAFKYATSYHLTFSLFTSSSSPSVWDIDAALDQYMQPLINAVSSVSQFTIDTQVQLHASFSPTIAGPYYDDASGKWQLRKTDLSGFINAAEWPLSPSIGAGPTINFVLYVPSEKHSPLEIAETGGTSWLIPQWGGVQIFNPSSSQSEKLTAQDLEPIMLTFADQLTALVGLPPTPPSLAVRLASLTRERATSLILSTSSTLGALARLTLKLTSIAIPDSVAQSVDHTISRLDEACRKLREGRFDSALESARIANDEAERAFFEPSMVGQAYFPDEHKVAVYVPLLGPMAVPLVMAALKELRKLRRGGKEEKA